MSWKNHLRLGLILVVTGIIALARYVFTSSGHLSPGIDLAVGIVLVLVGLPFLAIGIARMSRR